MRVGVYVDAFNVYFGGRYICGTATTGWKWLDIRSLAADLVARRNNWHGANIHRVVYCTALIDGAFNPDGRIRQDTYLRALQKTSTV